MASGSNHDPEAIPFKWIEMKRFAWGRARANGVLYEPSVFVTARSQLSELPSTTRRSAPGAAR